MFDPINDLTIWGSGPNHFGSGAISKAFVECLRYRMGVNLPQADTANTADWHGFMPNEITTAQSYGNVLLRNDLWSHQAQWPEFKPAGHTPLRLAYFGCANHLAKDRWGELLPQMADAIIVPDNGWRDALINTIAPGLDIPVFVLPIAFNPPPYPVIPAARNDKQQFIFGSYSPFHAASQLDILLAAFQESFGNNPNVMLRLAGPDLDQGNTVAALKATIDRHQLNNVQLQTANWSTLVLYQWLETLDQVVQLNAPTGLTVVPHMALALGKPTLLGRHPLWYAWQHYGLAQGVMGELLQPAQDAHGTYAYMLHRPYIYEVAEQLAKAYAQRETLNAPALQQGRQATVAPQHTGNLRYLYHQIAKPENIGIGAQNELHINGLTTTSPKLVELYERHTKKRTPLFIAANRPYRRRIVTAHDAGFFSIFNIYLSYLTWLDQYQDIRHVLPDWRVHRITEAWNKPNIGSFSYGRPEDGNCWLNLFEPPYDDITEAEMHDGERLFRGADADCTGYNRQRDLWCTDVYVTNLYRSPEFPAWRQRIFWKNNRKSVKTGGYSWRPIRKLSSTNTAIYSANIY